MQEIEKKYMDRVSELGCIVCRNQKYGKNPAVIHHIRTGQGISQRAPNGLIIPLCPMHHNMGGHGVAIHSGQKQWENLYGTELELLNQTILEVFDYMEKIK
jgi:hypothetical protein